MTTILFNPKEDIIVNVSFSNNTVVTAKLAFDTGASLTMLPQWIIKQLGLPINTKKTLEVTTASKIERVPIVIISQVNVASETVKNVEVIVKDLPPESYVAGLLGLNFIKHFNVNIDFKHGKLTLNKYL